MYKLSKTNVSNLIVNKSAERPMNVNELAARCTRSNVGYKSGLGSAAGIDKLRLRQCVQLPSVRTQ